MPRASAARVSTHPLTRRCTMHAINCLEPRYKSPPPLNIHGHAFPFTRGDFDERRRRRTTDYITYAPLSKKKRDWIFCPGRSYCPSSSSSSRMQMGSSSGLNRYFNLSGGKGPFRSRRSGGFIYIYLGYVFSLNHLPSKITAQFQTSLSSSLPPPVLTHPH